jgi:hypothetical protein
MATRFNPPPNWPVPYAGWVPPDGWAPPPTWPPPPPGWPVWVVESPLPSAATAVNRPAEARTRKRKIITWIAGVGTVVGVAASGWALATGIRDELGPPAARDGEISAVTVADYGSGQLGLNLDVTTEGFAGDPLVLLITGGCGASGDDIKADFQLIQTVPIEPKADSGSEVYSVDIVAPGVSGDQCVISIGLATPEGETLATLAADPFVLD